MGNKETEAASKEAEAGMAARRLKLLIKRQRQGWVARRLKLLIKKQRQGW